MSSKYQAEKLSIAIIDAALCLLGKGSVLIIKTLFSAIENQLNPAQRLALKRKGGIKELNRIINYLHYRQFIEIGKSKHGDRQAVIQSKGLKRLHHLSFQPLELNNGRWDGKWRVISFDIPEEYRGARDAVRRLIKELGFAPLHRSVWIHPLPCQTEIAVIQDTYAIKNHISLLEVGDFDRVEEFHKLFGNIVNTDDARMIKK